jgi:lysozyme family protein/uncharacterized protein YjdB
MNGKKQKHLKYVAVSLLASSLVTFVPFLSESLKAQSATSVHPTVLPDPTINPSSVTSTAAMTLEQPDKRYSVYQVNGNGQTLMNGFQNLNDAINFAKGIPNTKVIDEVSHNILWNNTVVSGSAQIKSFIQPPKPGANTSFDHALEFVLQWEGGYSNNPNDHGGPTNQGITQSEYDGYRKAKGQNPQDVKSISTDELRDIYYNGYWLPVHGNDLAYPLALAMFDSSVNCGPGTAIMFLQKSLGITEDASFGQAIVKALANTESKAEIAMKIMDHRDEYYKKIVNNDSTQVVFLQGWLNRNNALAYDLSQWIVQNHMYLDQAKYFIGKGNVYNAAYYVVQSLEMGAIQPKDAVSLGDSFSQNDRISFYQDLVAVANDSANVKPEVKNRFLGLAKSSIGQNDFDHAAGYGLQAFQMGATVQEVIGLTDSFSKNVQSAYWNSLVHYGQDLPPAFDAEFMKRQSVPVTGVSFDTASVSMTIGEAPKRLNAVLSPSDASDQKTMWATDNENVVKVDANGVVTPVGVGTAHIVVRTEDSGKTAQCTITVAAKASTVTGLSLDSTSLSLALGDNSKKLNAVLAPTNATDRKVSWNSDNENVVKVDSNGYLSPVGVGTAIVTATADDGGKKSTCKITVVASNLTVQPIKNK